MESPQVWVNGCKLLLPEKEKQSCDCHVTFHTSILLSRVYHRGKKSEVLDRVKRCKLEVVVTTHNTARTHVVCTYLIEFVEEMDVH